MTIGMTDKMQDHDDIEHAILQYDLFALLCPQGRCCTTERIPLYSHAHDITVKAQAWHLLCQQQRRRVQLIAQLSRKS